ncbi:MAG: DUF4397 domain-containing protein [bacterium]
MRHRPGAAPIERIAQKLRNTAVACGLTLALIFAITSCDAESTQELALRSRTPDGESIAPPAAVVEERDESLVRAVHAIPGVVAADIFVESMKVFASVEYKSVTSYKALPDETYLLSVRNAGQESSPALAEVKQNFSRGNHYTIVALPAKEAGMPATLAVLNDDITPPAAGKARVRAVHASAQTADLDLHFGANTDAFLSGLGFAAASAYVDVDPGVGTLQVCPKGSKAALLDVSNSKFEAGKSYTIFIVGDEDGLDTITVEDQLIGATSAHPVIGRTTN